MGDWLTSHPYIMHLHIFHTQTTCKRLGLINSALDCVVLDAQVL